MKLAFLNSSYRLGGAETVMHDLLDGSRAAGHDVRLYVAHGKTYPDDERLVPLYPAALSRLHHSRLQPVVEAVAPRLAWTDRAVRKLASGWADLVHVHNFHGDYATVSSLAHVARHKPLLWTLHGHWAVTGGCDHPLECDGFERGCGNCPRLGIWPVPLVDNTAEQIESKLRLLGGLPLHVVAPARYLAARVRRSRVGARWHVHHVPNGVSATAFAADRKGNTEWRRSLGIEPGARVIVVTNRDFKDRDKGFAMIREALAALAAAAPADVQVLMVGHNSDWAVSQLSPAIRPRSVGYVSSRQQMAALLEAANIFLFASNAENFPCAVLEAMAAGCCVVSTPTSGVTEQIVDGVTGVLASSLSGGALGRALVTTLQQSDLARRVGQEARTVATTEFSLDRMVERYLGLYEIVARQAVAARSTHRPVEPSH